ncbi:MAG: formate dehydrogenase accessory protein FdhE [Thermodesulfobacteriota bacterium]|nr:formate dehydrogenase accessory protein FdhE [Thermodesulfobacteriota bacterium]
MIIKPGCTSQDIIKASEKLKETKPHLNEILKFYEKIFILQEETINHIDPGAITISEDLVQTKLEHKFPLITKEEFLIDYKECENLLKKIYQICSDCNIEAYSSIESIVKLTEKQEITFKTMGEQYLCRGDNWLESFSKENDIDKKNLEFLLYNSLKPCIVKGSEQVSKYLKNHDTQDQGFCPVCGSSPGVSILADNGARSFACSFCWHKWETERIFCPYCNTKKSENLSYIYVENEKGIRGDVCNKCMKYIKTLDTREYNHDIYLPMELLGAIPLDMKINQEGYSN